MCLLERSGLAFFCSLNVSWCRVFQDLMRLVGRGEKQSLMKNLSESAIKDPHVQSRTS